MKGPRGIYLDHQATTPVDPRVLQAMLPYFHEEFGNAASRSHPYGWAAEEAVERAREQVATAIHAGAQEIVWTSGATEATNLAIQGVATSYAGKGDHLITGVTEHKATLDTCQHLARLGLTVSVLPVDRFGMLDPEQVRAAITARTILISLMHANNEVGTLHPIAAIGRIAKENGVLFHVDAAQTLGKLPLDVQAMGIDLLSMSGHKLYGPKGIGALYVRRKAPRVRLVPLLHGGGHERGLRSGTLNVPAIVGMGEAVTLAVREMAEECRRLTTLRDRLHHGILDQLDGVTLNGHPTSRLPNNLNLSFAGVDGESLLMGMKGIAVSSGSACTSAEPEPSYVLRALGVPDDLALASVRFGPGRFTTEADIDVAIGVVVENVRRLRARSPRVAVPKAGREGA